MANVGAGSFQLAMEIKIPRSRSVSNSARAPGWRRTCTPVASVAVCASMRVNGARNSVTLWWSHNVRSKSRMTSLTVMAPPVEFGIHVVEGHSAFEEKHQRVVEEVGGFFHKPLIGFGQRRVAHLAGFFLHLRGNGGTSSPKWGAGV